MSKVLLVDDEPRILLLLQSLLKTNKYEVETARDGNAALDIVRAGGVDIMITDLRMAPMDGMALFQEVHRLQPSMPVILLTAYASVETAIEAMKQGMFDYLTKPFKVDDILACLARAEEKVKKHESVALSMDIDTPPKYRFENLIGSSPLMTQVCDMIQKVAPTAATVLINGESGTGKEVIAKTIHKNSPRANKPWVAVNCAALPENLLESEMFGHMKGSFTGAYSDKQGLFEVANGGTLFLDEIGDLSIPVQVKLLRFLQERTFSRVGSNEMLQSDVRFIAATSRNLEDLMAKKLFREDLYYRLSVFPIALPRLADRADDVVLLAQHFLTKMNVKYDKGVTQISVPALNALKAYSWPGNVRELENCIERAVLTTRDACIHSYNLPAAVQTEEFAEDPFGGGNTSLSLDEQIAAFERRLLEDALNRHGGSHSAAARELGLSPRMMSYRLSRSGSSAFKGGRR